MPFMSRSVPLLVKGENKFDDEMLNERKKERKERKREREREGTSTGTSAHVVCGIFVDDASSKTSSRINNCRLSCYC